MESLPEVTFLMLDIEGSTRRWEVDPLAAAAAVARFDDLVADAVARHGGDLVRVRGEGDSHLITFPDPGPAAGCIADLQRRFHAEPWAGGPMRVRAALHHGTVEARDGTYYGRVVNRCARLRALAAGGQVLLSGASAAVVAEEPPDGCALLDHGEHRLKDLDAPERVWELRIAGLPADFPPLQGMPATRHNLPIQITSFRGRGRAVADAVGLLRDRRLVTLTGAGGIGKTRLAVHVAAELVDDTPDGVWLVELGSLGEAALVDVAVATALGLRTPPGSTTRSILLEAVRDRELLVVLDNCEHLLAASADLVGALLTTAPGVRVLATSREPLGLPGEHRVRLGPLDLPAPVPPIGQLTPAVSAAADGRSAAVELFFDRATAVRPDLDRGGPAVQAAAAAIVRAVDGLPLAIELAAARAAHLTLEDLAARLTDQLALLADRRRPGRHATLRAAIGWSHDLLTEAEQVVLRRVAVFPDSFPLEAAEAVVAGVDGTTGADVLDLLAQLVDRSLVVPELGGRRTRHRLLQPIRYVALEQLDRAGERDAARRALLDWIADLAGTRGADVEQIAPEVESARAVLEGPSAELDRRRVLQLAADLLEVWRQRLPSEGAARLAALLVGHAHPDRVRGAALHALGELRLEDDVDTARELHAEAAAIATAIGDPLLSRRARIGMAAVDIAAFAHDAAIPALEVVIAEGRAAGDEEAVAEACNHLGVAVGRRGEIDRAEVLLQEAHDVWTALGRAGPAAGAAISLAAHVHSVRGHYERAVEVLEAAIEEADARGYRVLAMRAATNLGRAYTGMGALTTARRWLADGLARARTLGNVTGQAWGQALLGELERQAGALGEAAVRYERSIELFERVGNAANRLYLRSALAHIALAGGRAEEAESTGLAILAEAVAVDDPDAVVEFVELVAEARAAGDDPEVVTAAVRLLGAAEARRLVLGIPREPVDQPDRDAAVDRAVACLGRSAVAEALAAGADRPWSAVLEDVADPLAPRVSGPRPASA